MIDYMDSAEKLKCITQRSKVYEKPSNKWLVIIAALTLIGGYLILDDRKGDFNNDNRSAMVHQGITKS